MQAIWLRNAQRVYLLVMFRMMEGLRIRRGSVQGLQQTASAGRSGVRIHMLTAGRIASSEDRVSMEFVLIVQMRYRSCTSPTQGSVGFRSTRTSALEGCLCD